MRARTTGEVKGFVLYYEDLAALQKQLTAEDAMSVIVALGAYARTGERPEEGTLSPAAAMAFEMMAYKVEQSLKAYGDTSEKRKQAAQRRWSRANANDTSDACEQKPCNSMQSNANDANACKSSNGMHLQTKEKKRNEMNKESKEDISSIARENPPAPPDLLSVDEDELIAQAGINRQIEAAGRKAGVFVRDWDDGSLAARNERDDFELMLEYKPAWVLEAIDRASQVHKASSRYVLGILRSFKERGKSDIEAKAERESARLSRDPPAFEVIDGVAYSDGMEWIE